MRTSFITATALATAALAAQAQTQGPEMGRVLSVTPVSQQVAVPRQVCNDETLYSSARPTTGAGAVLGAIAGGAAGNAIGGGGGRALATAVGVIGGAMLGNNVEGGQPGYQNVQRCTTQTTLETQPLGYDVTYEYAGRRYTTRMAQDPGQWVALSVQPLANTAPQSPPTGYDSGYYGTAPQAGYEPQGYAPQGYAPPVYVQPAVGAVIEYRDAHGRPYQPPRHSRWGY
ncbi:hypothetical protein GCM10022279_15390 [Comamonas faecalis]|uniref:Glycine zipper 2TM domain-containing protein n=1 Tax=Comamonas faecalis TaxID=1387849 RepID=A0ABP7R719_9BURK